MHLRTKEKHTRSSGAGHGLLLAFLVSGVLALTPTTALGATASVVGGVLTYTAADGETNTVTLLPIGLIYRVDDTGASITAGSGCTAVDSDTVDCLGVTSISVSAGDMADMVSVTGPTNSTLNGGIGNDTLTGGAGADIANGDNNDDVFDGGAGADIFNGGGGSDTVTYASRLLPVAADIDGFADDGELLENDNVAADVENILGGSGGDTLTGSSSANTLSGNGGDDVLNGADGDDLLDGGAGADSFSGGGSGSDTVTYASRLLPVAADTDGFADDGELLENDNVAADVENLTGGSGGDSLTGSSAVNTLNGNAGSDTLDGGTGSDTLSGGADIDTVSYSGRTADVIADIDGVADDGEPGENDEIRTDVQNLIGGAGSDTLTGSSGSNSLAGNGSNDTLDGGSDSDALSGGPGADTVTYASRAADVSADLDGVSDDGVAGENDSLAPDIENITSGAGADTLTGSSGSNTLTGGGGNDTLDGGTGADVLNGGSGSGDAVTYASRSATVTADIDGVTDDGETSENDNVQTDVENLTGGSSGDTLTGNSGVNSLTGGAGDDTIEGGEGADTLSGEGGADTLRSRDASGDSVSCGSESDSVIADSQDSVAADCESVDLGSTGGGSEGGGSTGGGGSTPPPSGGGGGTTPSPAGKISIKTRKATMSKSGLVTIRMGCNGGSCSGGTASVETAAKVRLAAKANLRKVKLGNYRFSAVASGRVFTIKVKLPAKLRKLVLAKKSLALRVKAVNRGTTVSATVRCLAPKTKKRKR
jgi:Ca2+-binding RTX toxin-like protein